MKRFLFAVIGLLSLSFADIHPGLKNAIDNGDIKTAENLVKKFGVKDVYCPANLSFENAMTIYENVFSTNPLIMWKNCNPSFIKKAEKNICKISVPLCKHYLRILLQNEEMESLDSAFEEILQSGIHLQKEVKEVEQLEIVKATTKECLEQLEKARNKLADSIITWHNNECKLFFDETSCAKIFSKYGTASIDSVNSVYAANSKQCKKKPTKTIVNYREKEITVNPFLYEIEYYGILLSKKIKNPFWENNKNIDTYRKIKSNNIPDSKSKDNIKIYWNALSKDMAAYCIAFSEKNTFSGECQKAISRYVGSLSLSSSKNAIIKELSHIYATSGIISDSLILFSCKVYPEIDKDFIELMEVNVFDCDIVNRYLSEIKKCANSDTNYIQTMSGSKYACDKKKWRLLKLNEEKIGVCSKEGEKKSGMYCAENIGWVKDVGYKTFLDKRDNQIYRAVKIGDQIWMAENLRYKVDQSRCYENERENCDKYGRLYTWYSIMSENDNGCINKGTKECFEKQPIQGICPDGWHIPSEAELEIFLSKIERNNWSADVKSTDGWADNMNGTNTYGFNAFPMGTWSPTGRWIHSESNKMKVYFFNKGYNTAFWSSSINERYNANALSFCNFNSCSGVMPLDMDEGISLRCIKDSKSPKRLPK